MSEPLRLNLGSGYTFEPSNWLPGYINVDTCYGNNERVYLYEDKYQVQGARVYPLGYYTDESADEVRASHILEHFSHTQTADVLREWIRVLKPGGVLKLAVPNFDWIAEKYLAGEDVNVQGYVMGGHVDENDHHGATFDRDGLTDAMQALGLVDIKPWVSEIDDCASLPVSLNLQGTKAGASAQSLSEDTAEALEPIAEDHEPVPDWIASHPDARFAEVTIPKGDIEAVMTVPRLGFTSFMACATQALGMLHIPLKMSGGVYWNQGVEKVLSATLANGTKYALCLDFDTVFDWRDIQTLYGLMEARPDIDALCAVQMRREQLFPLLTIKGDDGKNVARLNTDLLANDVMPISTAHFGLTLIRTSALTNMPRPWFHEQADEEGGWGDGRVDADIAFWNQFAEAGNKLYQANRVAVGHLELMVTWPDQNLKPQFQYSGNYHDHGKPVEAWT